MSELPDEDSACSGEGKSGIVSQKNYPNINCSAFNGDIFFNRLRNNRHGFIFRKSEGQIIETPLYAGQITGDALTGFDIIEKSKENNALVKGKISELKDGESLFIFPINDGKFGMKVIDSNASSKVVSEISIILNHFMRPDCRDSLYNRAQV